MHLFTCLLAGAALVLAAPAALPEPYVPSIGRHVESTNTTIPGWSEHLNQIRKRGGDITFADNCNGARPAGNNWDNGGPYVFDTMIAVLQFVMLDTYALGRSASGVAADNKGFTHYFGGTGADVQLDHFKRMTAAIGEADRPTIRYSINFECSNVPSCDPDSIMVTTTSAGSATDRKTIEVCPNFWTDASTRYVLHDPQANMNMGPFRTNDAGGWCRKTPNTDFSARRHDFFVTAAHTVLHELTHLSSLAQYAGLEADAEGKHGTLDDQDDKGYGSGPEGSRRYLQEYINGNTDDTSPDYNAESYASAATEIYFMDLCGFTEIRPLT